MSYFKEKGLVIREIHTGEADKVITVLSENHGKITGYVKGARRPRSRFVSCTQFLCYSEFMLYKGKDMYQVYGCDGIEPFYNIRNDLGKLTYTAHMADLVLDVIQENQSAAKTLQLFLNSLFMISNSSKSLDMIARVFEFRLLSILGYSPHMKNCQMCGSSDTGNFSFSFNKCGILCSHCAGMDKSAVAVSNGTVCAILHIMTSNIKDIFKFEVSNEVRGELERLAKRYLKERLERDYNKLEFLKSIR